MDYIFVAKKVAQAFLLPPGLWVLLLAIVLFNLRSVKNAPRAKWLIVIVLLLIYACSIRPVSYSLLHPLEYAQPFPKQIDGELVVMLGGGSIADTPDFGGSGTLGGGSSARLIAAVRAARSTDAALLITSGAVLGVPSAECDTVKRYARGMGIPADRVLIDNNAKDTQDNAVNTVALCRESGYKRIIVVTSAYHIPRARVLFEQAISRSGYNLHVTYLPAGYLSPEHYTFTWADALPENNEGCYAALHEYFGLAACYVGLK